MARAGQDTPDRKPVKGCLALRWWRIEVGGDDFPSAEDVLAPLQPKVR